MLRERLAEYYASVVSQLYGVSCEPMEIEGVFGDLVDLYESTISMDTVYGTDRGIMRINFIMHYIPLYRKARDEYLRRLLQSCCLEERGELFRFVLLDNEDKMLPLTSSVNNCKIGLLDFNGKVVDTFYMYR